VKELSQTLCRFGVNRVREEFRPGEKPRQNGESLRGVPPVRRNRTCMGIAIGSPIDRRSCELTGTKSARIPRGKKTRRPVNHENLD